MCRCDRTELCMCVRVGMCSIFFSNEYIFITVYITITRRVFSTSGNDAFKSRVLFLVASWVNTEGISILFKKKSIL